MAEQHNLNLDSEDTPITRGRSTTPRITTNSSGVIGLHMPWVSGNGASGAANTLNSTTATTAQLDPSTLREERDEVSPPLSGPFGPVHWAPTPLPTRRILCDHGMLPNTIDESFDSGHDVRSGSFKPALITPLPSTSLLCPTCSKLNIALSDFTRAEKLYVEARDNHQKDKKRRLHKWFNVRMVMANAEKAVQELDERLSEHIAKEWGPMQTKQGTAGQTGQGSETGQMRAGGRPHQKNLQNTFITTSSYTKIPTFTSTFLSATAPNFTPPSTTRPSASHNPPKRARFSPTTLGEDHEYRPAKLWWRLCRSYRPGKYAGDWEDTSGYEDLEEQIRENQEKKRRLRAQAWAEKAQKKGGEGEGEKKEEEEGQEEKTGLKRKADTLESEEM